MSHMEETLLEVWQPIPRSIQLVCGRRLTQVQSCLHKTSEHHSTDKMYRYTQTVFCGDDGASIDQASDPRLQLW